MFSFQTLSKANDINDFEIDGISLGDSALDYFSKSFIVNELESELTYFYKDQKFAIINTNIQSKQYDRISLTIKPNDENLYYKHEFSSIGAIKDPSSNKRPFVRLFHYTRYSREGIKRKSSNKTG